MGHHAVFLIWGEAANLKHMPEALCWLYQTMSTEAQGEDLINQSHHGSMGVWREIPAGHFLENVICPMCRCVAAGMKLENRRNYDDMNEVFWSPRHDKNYSYDKNDSSREHVSSGLEQVSTRVHSYTPSYVWAEEFLVETCAFLPLRHTYFTFTVVL